MLIENILTNNTDEILALVTVGITMTVAGYLAVIGSELAMMTEPAMLVLGFYFGRKVTK